MKNKLRWVDQIPASFKDKRNIIWKINYDLHPIYILQKFLIHNNLKIMLAFIIFFTLGNGNDMPETVYSW